MARGTLTISLDAIRVNYTTIAAKSSMAVCAAVVKADAYGLGIEPVARALAGQGATHFFVALPEEGIALRQHLPDVAIYILNGLLAGEEKDALHHRLIPVLNDPVALGRWQANAAGKVLPAILHVDTGLNRLGFNERDFIRSTADLLGLDVRYIMSHLACADRPEHPMNDLQLNRFKSALGHLAGIKASLAASDGIFCGPDFHFDMVRPGAALYGLNPTPGRPNPMRPCVSLSVPILQIRQVEKDGTVGYAASQTVREKQFLATVSLGYADGFSRSLSNNGHLFCRGIALPIVGRVSMDVVTVDLSPLQTQPEQGEMLEVFGPSQSPDDLAAAAGTIGYEILTSLGRRFDRVYTDAAHGAT